MDTFRRRSWTLATERMDIDTAKTKMIHFKKARAAAFNFVKPAVGRR
jgi:hypothetical protein